MIIIRIRPHQHKLDVLLSLQLLAEEPQEEPPVEPNTGDAVTFSEDRPDLNVGETNLQ